MFEAIQRPVLEQAEALQGALLYLDAGAGEIAQTTLGLPFLMGLGVSHVCSLELASPDDSVFPVLVTGQAPSRLAVFTTQMLTDVHQHLLRAVLAHPAATSVSVYCSVTEHAHACQAATDLGVEAYREYADLLRREVSRLRAPSQQPHNHHGGDVDGGGGSSSGVGGVASSEGGGGGGGGGGAAPPGDPGLTVRVTFLPLLACCLDAGLFVLPASSSAARRGVTGAVAAGFGPAEAAADAAAGEGASGGLSLTAHALLALAAALGVPRPEAFPIGPVSNALAAELASLPSVSIPSATAAAAASSSSSSSGASSSSPPPSLALILVDRSLDLASPCSHTDQPWDVVLGASASRQAAAAVRGAEASSSGRRSGGPQALWRPLDLRVGLPAAAVPTPAEVAGGPLPMAGPGDPPGPAPDTSHLPYGQLSYVPFGAELLDPTDRTAVARVEAVGGRGRKEALAALRRGLKEALRAEKLTPSVRSKAGAVQAPELRGLAESLLAVPGSCMRQRGVAALGMAVAEAMSGQAAEEWEAAAGLERSALAALAGGGGGGGGGGGEAAAQVLLDALAAAKAGHGLLHAGHVLEVLPAIYSAAADSAAADATSAASTSSAASATSPLPHNCPFSPGQQAAVRAALAEAVLAAPRPAEQLGGRLPAALVAELAARRAQQASSSSASSSSCPSEGQQAAAHLELAVEGALDGLLYRLQYVAGARGRLKEFKKVTHMDVFAENHGAINPLLRQVVRRMLQRAELSDWQQQSSTGGGGGGLVRGLLGGLMGASRALVAGAGGGGGGLKQPGDFATVVVFVVGGVSAAEVREVRAEVEEHVGSAKPRVLVGGTSLLLPQDVVLQLAGGLLQ